MTNNRMPFAQQRPKDPNTGEKGDIAVYTSELVYIIGIVGVNDMVQFHTGKQLHEDESAKRLAVRTLTEMELYAMELSERCGMKVVLARTPAETTCQRFAVSDLLDDDFHDYAKEVVKGNLEKAISMANETRDLPIYYTNGAQVPVDANISLAERIEIEHIFFPIVDGGNILHVFMGESYPDYKGLKSLAMKIALKTQTGYFAFTKDMTVCMDDFYVSSGLNDECPNCGSSNVEHLSRVTGYIQAVSGWNEAKKQELEDRKRYSSDMM
jgi:ribonucleoside-triphosphate reductase